jgi:hypothetical protein
MLSGLNEQRAQADEAFKRDRLKELEQSGVFSSGGKRLPYSRWSRGKSVFFPAESFP